MPSKHSTTGSLRVWMRRSLQWVRHSALARGTLHGGGGAWHKVGLVIINGEHLGFDKVGREG